MKSALTLKIGAKQGSNNRMLFIEKRICFPMTIRLID